LTCGWGPRAAEPRRGPAAGAVVGPGPENVAEITLFTTGRSVLEHAGRDRLAMSPGPERRPACRIRRRTGMRTRPGRLATRPGRTAYASARSL
jgi:hypothetical protein